MINYGRGTFLYKKGSADNVCCEMDADDMDTATVDEAMDALDDAIDILEDAVEEE